MKASELIKNLNCLIEQYGDLDVFVYDCGEDYYFVVVLISKENCLLEGEEEDDEENVKDIFSIEYY